MRVHIIVTGYHAEVNEAARAGSRVPTYVRLFAKADSMQKYS